MSVTGTGGIRVTKYEGFRLYSALLAAAGTLVLWQAAVVVVLIMPHEMRGDGPAVTFFALLILTCEFKIPLLGIACIGVPYAFHLRRRNRLDFRTIMRFTAVMALIYGLVVYGVFSMYPQRWLSYSFGPLSTAGTLLSGLCFYIVGTWRTNRRRRVRQGEATPDAARL